MRIPEKSLKEVLSLFLKFCDEFKRLLPHLEITVVTKGPSNLRSRVANLSEDIKDMMDHERIGVREVFRQGLNVGLREFSQTVTDHPSPLPGFQLSEHETEGIDRLFGQNLKVLLDRFGVYSPSSLSVFPKCSTAWGSSRLQGSAGSQRSACPSEPWIRWSR